ncbi:MAG: FAD-dependent oxidoreductase [Flavobacteriales bacterium]|nr:FAD-dependent oxidoreductase [Flavobacteriales bacterium]
MVLIIGAGLSGLLIGYRLKQLHIPFKIIEARDRIGGRIHTIHDENSTPMEMGATWFGDQHVQLKQLLEELEIEMFEQFMSGTSFFQPFSTSPASAIPIPPQDPSYRVVGGTTSLIKKLAEGVGEDQIDVNSRVESIELEAEQVNVATKQGNLKAAQVVLAIPPKLWANSIQFEPKLPDELLQTSLNTQTWMEGSVKVALSFNTPFWRENGQSGTLFSNTGPIVEFYDHSNAQETKHALCGFMNPAYQELSFHNRKESVLQQLEKVFGSEIRNHVTYQELLWDKEEETSSPSIQPLIPHQNNGASVFHETQFDKRLFFSGTETSPIFPGYMEGAVLSAERVVDSLKTHRDSK